MIVPGQGRLRFIITKITLSLASETTVQFKSGSSLITGPIYMIALSEVGSLADPLYVMDHGQPFVINLGAAVQCGGVIQGMHTS